MFMFRSKFAPVVLVSIGLLGSLGCGGGGGTENFSDVSVAPYESWLTATLLEQKDVVQDSFASFVDLGPTGSSDILTNIVGWIKIDQASSIDQLKRFSNTPESIAGLLAESTDVIASSGRSIELKGEFKKESTVGLNIPIVSAILNFSKSKSVGGSFSITISYESKKTFWIGDRAMQNLLQNGAFTPTFLSKVAAGEVKIYRGLLALHNVKISLNRKSNSGGNFSVGDSVKDPKTGVVLNVTSNGSGSNEGTITLTATDDLFVGISQRILGPGDLGLIATKGQKVIAGIPISFASLIEKKTGKGNMWLRNDGNFAIENLSYIPIAFKDAKGNPTEVIKPLDAGYFNLLAGQKKEISFDFGVSPTDEYKSAHPAIVGWAWSATGYVGNNRAGTYKCSLLDTSFTGGLGPRMSLTGIVEGNGDCIFYDSDGVIVLKGEMDSSGVYHLSSNLHEGLISGLAVESSQGLIIEVSPRYRLVCIKNLGSTGGSPY